MAVSTVPPGQGEGLMGPRTHDGRLGSRDRIAAFAKATELYAESLEDPDLANVYWGKSLGLWQAVAILSAEGRRPVAVSGRSSLSARPIRLDRASPPRPSLRRDGEPDGS
jgi:hypothetical protein